MEDNVYRSPESTMESSPGKKRQNPILKLIKILLIGLGSIVVLITILMVWASFSTPSFDELDPEAERLANVILPILSNNEYDQIEPYLHSELIDSAPKEDILKIFNTYSRLGSYISHEILKRGDCRFNAGTNNYSKCEFSISAKYTEFDANIILGVIKEGDITSVYRIHVNSDLYLQ